MVVPRYGGRRAPTAGSPAQALVATFSVITLLEPPGAIVTPHVGGGGPHTRGAMADAAMDELERFFGGDAVQHRVTTDMLSRMT